MSHFTTVGKQAAYLITCVILLFSITTQSLAQTAPNLGTASTYGAFTGAGAIGNTGLTVITGDIGTNVGSFTGFPPGQYTGAKHVADAATLAAKNDLIVAYNSMNDATHAVIFDTALNATMGNGQVLTPQTYGRGDLTTISGNLTFDAKGNPAAVFIIKIRAALNVAGNTHLLLINGAQAANIYWAINGAVSILDNSIFKGTIVSNGAIHLYGGSSLEGRALAVFGAITMASNVVSIPGSSAPGDRLVVITPAPGDSLKGGTQNYQITWGGSGIATMKTLEYSLDSGMTWISIGTISADVFAYSWSIPDTVSNKALVRITDQNNLRGISGMFKIASSKVPGTIAVVHPSPGEIITGGMQNYQITWSGTGLSPQKTFELSLDAGLTWKMIGTISTETFAYSWNVPDTASTQTVIRITDQNGITAKSGVFTIKSSKPNPGSIVIVRPTLGESVIGGTQNYQIIWSGTSLAPQKTIELSLDGGTTWKLIGTISTEAFIYGWNVPDTTTTEAVIRITDQLGNTGKSGLFSILSSNPNPGSIIVLHPVAGEVLDGGTQNFLITFTAVNTAVQKRIDYSLDGGSTWSLIGFLATDAQSFSWANVPNVATTQALVRIMDANGVTGISGLFTIKLTPGTGSINSLFLSGLNNKNNIGNNNTLGINWTFTPEIGTSVEVEYSLDYMATWSHIATVQTSESPNALWTTPVTGFYNPVFIRVTSSLGMTRTSVGFSIGTSSSVASESSRNGYSVSNYPNPAGSSTTLSFELPVAGNASLAILDGLGREVVTIAAQHFDIGSHTIAIATSSLPTGNYTYILRTESVTLSGKMAIVK